MHARRFSFFKNQIILAEACLVLSFFIHCSLNLDKYERRYSYKEKIITIIPVSPVSFTNQFYRSNVISILEYALQVWQNIPVYLSERIESVQKTAFKIIHPDSSYNQALILVPCKQRDPSYRHEQRDERDDMSNLCSQGIILDNETKLSIRREFLSNKLMIKNRFLVSSPEHIIIPYNLRSGAVRPTTKLR